MKFISFFKKINPKNGSKSLARDNNSASGQVAHKISIINLSRSLVSWRRMLGIAFLEVALVVVAIAIVLIVAQKSGVFDLAGKNESTTFQQLKGIKSLLSQLELELGLLATKEDIEGGLRRVGFEAFVVSSQVFEEDGITGKLTVAVPLGEVTHFVEQVVNQCPLSRTGAKYLVFFLLNHVWYCLPFPPLKEGLPLGFAPDPTFPPDLPTPTPTLTPTPTETRTAVGGGIEGD
ncbi:MAG TPA: hypothetical protein PKD37_04275 [Oligoflexia bacterium]|nr:hypothetical protein [Oligoflexia bacterium]HMP27183.1 hypothetical protein [Oligoflexia bacterium]